MPCYKTYFAVSVICTALISKAACINDEDDRAAKTASGGGKQNDRGGDKQLTPQSLSRYSSNTETINIVVKSSVHQLLVTVEGKDVLNVTTTEEDRRDSSNVFSHWIVTSGLHLVVLNPNNGRVKFHRTVMTSDFGLSQEIPSLLSSLTAGNILVLAIKNDGALNLTPKARDVLKSRGVKAAEYLEYRNFFAWVGTVGGKSWGESYSADNNDKGNFADLWSSPILLDVEVPRRLDASSCFDSDDQREERRASFCEQYDGYGSLCSCEKPAPLSYNPPELEGSVITNVPLVVVAGNRPTYLYRTLVTLLRQPGANTQRILVYIDGHHPEVVQLLDLLQVPYEEHIHGDGDFKVERRIAEHYRHALETAFSRYPDAPKAILLEEDLLTAPDFFSYFNQTAWLLDSDSTLWCVSAWNDLSSLHVAHDPRLLRRVETLPGLGWMLTRSLAVELLASWSTKKENEDWDIWAREPFIIGGRECVVPDVSRTFHIGLAGAHNPGVIHAAFFSAKPVTAQSNVMLKDVDRMILDKYEQDIHQLLQDDPLFLDTELEPCHTQYLPRNITVSFGITTSAGFTNMLSRRKPRVSKPKWPPAKDKPVVIFIEMVTSIDYLAWKHLARCLGLWDQDTRAIHRGLFHFFFYETQVMVIGYPSSDYSFYKPLGIKPLRVDDPEDLHKLDLVAPTNRARFRRPELEAFAPFLDTALPVMAP